MLKIEKCPYCDAEMEIERPFARLVKILFWWIEIPCGSWWATCSKYCDDFRASETWIREKTKRKVIKSSNEWALSVKQNSRKAGKD